MNAHGEGTLTFESVVLNVPNCGVEGLPGGANMITTKRLVTTTAGQGDNLKFAPKPPNNIFAEFKITGTCSIAGQIVTVKGIVVGVPNGAKVVFTHAATTAQKTLVSNNAISGINGELTLESRLKGSTGSYTPLSFTT